jgi:16S rRNA G966 N2-methylase RsmD
MSVQRYKNIPDSFINFNITPLTYEQNSGHVALSHAGKYDFDTAFLVDQLLIYPKAVVKIPSFTAVYAKFTPQSFEQSSSEVLANIKSSLIFGKRILDLSGGLGVDDWAFSKRFEQVVSLDIDAELNKLVRYNFTLLQVANIQRIDIDAYQYVHNNVERFDWVYLDADRRVKDKRSYSLFTFSENILLKVSPMVDIHAIITECKTVKEIWIVSHKNEVKEILVHLQQTESLPMIHALNIDGEQHQQFSKQYPIVQQELQPAVDGLWFYEPALSLIKAYLATSYMQERGISQVANHSLFGVSPTEVKDFFGRRFKLYESFVFSKGRLKTYLANNSITKANITKRNFPMDVAEIRQLTGLKEGGTDYLFFALDAAGEKRVFHCGKP